MKRIKVLIVDDSAVTRDFLEKNLSSDSLIEVVGKASNAIAAKDKIFFKKPDVITLDIEMPGINGLEFLRRLMLTDPLPVIMVSAMTESGSKATLQALEYGAVDFVLKASSTNGITPLAMITDLKEKIKMASNVDLSKFIKKKEYHLTTELEKRRKIDLQRKSDKIIAIGASTGGTQALTKIIEELPENIPGTVVVQHMPPVFTKMFADRLNSISKVSVKEAENGDIIANGKVYIAPGGLQMRILKRSGYFEIECTRGEPVNGHSPSVDVLFESVAKNAGSNAIGVVLTGMGRDGANGLLKMRQAGAKTFAQDEESSLIFGMPKEAYKCGGAQNLVNLDDIAKTIISYI
jgi:two-component system chemotaxis response regulator CheB